MHGIATESESIFGAMFEGANYGIILTDAASSKFIHANRKARQMLGYGDEDLTNMELADICVPGAASPVRPGSQGGHRDEKSFTRDMPLTRRDGRVIFTDMSCFPVTVDGQSYVAGFFRESSGRKYSEEMLRTQHELLQAVNNVDDLSEALHLCIDSALSNTGMDCGAVYLKDPDGGLELIAAAGLSKQFIESARYYPPDSVNARLVMSGEPVYVRRCDLEGGLSQAKRQEALRALAVIPIEYEQRVIGCLNVADRTMNETPEHCRVLLEAIASEAGMIIRRAQTDEALKKSEEHYRLLAEAGRDVVFLVSHDGRILYVNQRGAESTGLSAAEISGKHLSEALPPGTAEVILGSIEEVILSAKARRRDIRHEAFGLTEWAEVNIVPVPEAGEGEPGVLIVSRDITHHKQAEAALARKNAALYELIEQMATEKDRIGLQIGEKLEEVIMPLLARLRTKGDLHKYIDLLVFHLRNLTSAYIPEAIREEASNLTPREKEVCDMIRAGLTSKEIAGKIQALSGLMAIVSAGVGLLVLGGWFFDVALLKSLIPGHVTMKANTALAFLMAGAGLRLISPFPETNDRENGLAISQKLSLVLSALVILTGLSTLAEYAWGIDFHVDSLLFSESGYLVQTSHPGRMAPGTAINFIFLGLGITLAGFRPSRASMASGYLALGPLLISFLAILGYMYGAAALYWVGGMTAMAVNTAITFAILSLGLMLSCPDSGWISYLSLDNMGGAMLRRLLPVIILGIPFLFWIRLIGQRAGYYGTEFGISLMVLASISVLSWVVIRGAIILNRSENHIKESQEKYRNLFLHSPVAVFINRQDRVALVNQACLELFKADRAEQLEGRSIWELFHPDYHPDIKARIASLREDLTSVPPVEEAIIRLDGSLRQVEVTAAPFILDQAPAIHVMLRDITDRLRAEQSLRERDELFQEVGHMAQVGGWKFDVRTGEGGWTDEVARIHDMDPDEKTNRKIGLDVFRGEDRRRIEEAISDAVAQGRSYDLELEMVTRQGNRKWVRTMGRPILEDNQVVSLRGAIQDITRQKMMDQDLRRSEKNAKRLNRQLMVLQEAMSRFAQAGSLEETMAVARSAARRLADADGATFVIRDGDRCFYADEEGIAPLWKGRRFPMEDCISGWVMLNNRPVVIEDIYADPRIPAEA